jgi:hypothetical protein
MTKPVFKTKAAAESAIETNPQYAGCSAMFVSDYYAAGNGVPVGGWYLYSCQKHAWTVN